MSQNRNEDDASAGVEFPEARSTVQVPQEGQVVEVFTHYKGKANAYTVERTAVVAVLDRQGRAIEPVWGEDWTEISRGIETRGERSVARMQGYGTTWEDVKTGSIRVGQTACPVYLHFRTTSEYTSYDVGGHCESSSSDYWIRYERAPRKPKTALGSDNAAPNG